MPRPTTLRLLNRDPKKMILEWEIPNFHLYFLSDDRLVSDSFGFQPKCDKWNLICYPTGRGQLVYDYISLFICTNCEVVASFDFAVLDVNRGRRRVITVKDHSFCRDEEVGSPKYLRREEVVGNSLIFLPNGSLNFECTLTLDDPGQISLSYTLLNGNKKLRLDLADDFGNLVFNTFLSDVDIVVGDKTLPAHKCVLAVRSTVFRTMLCHTMIENGENKVVITDIDEDVLKEMLHFLYTGHAPNAAEMPEKLFIAADKYDLDGLKKLCELILIKGVCEENACKMYLFATEHDLPLLKSCVSSLTASNMESIINTPDFDDIIESHPAVIKQLFFDYVKKHKK